MRSVIVAAVLATAFTAYAQKDWPTAGHDFAGTRYSTLKQIDTRNVTQLERAWTYHMNEGATPPPAAAARAWIVRSRRCRCPRTRTRRARRTRRTRWTRWARRPRRTRRQLRSHSAGDRWRHVSHHRRPPRGRARARDRQGNLELHRYRWRARHPRPRILGRR